MASEPSWPESAGAVGDDDEDALAVEPGVRQPAVDDVSSVVIRNPLFFG